MVWPEDTTVLTGCDGPSPTFCVNDSICRSESEAGRLAFSTLPRIWSLEARHPSAHRHSHRHATAACVDRSSWQPGANPSSLSSWFYSPTWAAANESLTLFSAAFRERCLHIVSYCLGKPCRDSARLKDVIKLTHSSLSCSSVSLGTRSQGRFAAVAFSAPRAPEPGRDWLDPNWPASVAHGHQVAPCLQAQLLNP